MTFDSVVFREFVEIERYGLLNSINEIVFCAPVNQRNNKSNDESNWTNFTNSKTKISNAWRFRSNSA